MVNAQMGKEAAAGMNSMTGFASREGGADGLAWTWELRSVNARGLDLRLRLPDRAASLDRPIRARLSAALNRGSVSLGLRLREAGGVSLASPADAALSAAAALAARAQAAMKAADISVAPTPPTALLNLPGVMSTSEADTKLPSEALLADFDHALEALLEMRACEGAALAAVLADHLARMTEATLRAKAAVATRGADRESRFQADVLRLVEAAGQAVDPAKLAQDLATLIVKGDVSEELDRLDAHLKAAGDLLTASGPVGRKLDFLMQEFNREANTLCAKSSDTELTQAGLDLKVLIDQMREQVQNVE